MVCDRSTRSVSSPHTSAIGNKCVCPPLSEKKPELILVHRHRSFISSLLQSAQNFFAELRKVFPGRPPPLVLALDEAHVMSDRGLLDLFSSVLSDLKHASADWNGDIHFATIFLSTNFKLNNIAPSTGQISSQRLCSIRLTGALTCVPFDVFVDKEKEWTVKDISTLKFISTFGRPL
jgi:hypothetical protein